MFTTICDSHHFTQLCCQLASFIISYSPITSKKYILKTEDLPDVFKSELLIILKKMCAGNVIH